MLTLGWSDGNSVIPVNHCLLSAVDDKNLLCDARNFDGYPLPENVANNQDVKQQLEEFTASFVQRLPKYMQEALLYGQKAA